MDVALILLLAGDSRRMGRNKMLLSLCGRTPLEHCIGAALGCNTIFSTVVAVASSDTQSLARRCLAESGLQAKTIVVGGGDTRMQSVLNGLRAASADVAVIHDTARCLITPDIIDQSVESARQYGSGVVGIKARDTLWDEERGPLDRSRVFMAQTPQTFRYAEILNAYEQAVREGLEATDDCGVYEHMGYRARFVSGSLMNQKLTLPEDVAFFEAVLKGRGE